MPPPTVRRRAASSLLSRETAVDTAPSFVPFKLASTLPVLSALAGRGRITPPVLTVRDPLLLAALLARCWVTCNMFRRTERLEARARDGDKKWRCWYRENEESRTNDLESCQTSCPVGTPIERNLKSPRADQHMVCIHRRQLLHPPPSTNEHMGDPRRLGCYSASEKCERGVERREPAVGTTHARRWPPRRRTHLLGVVLRQARFRR